MSRPRAVWVRGTRPRPPTEGDAVSSLGRGLATLALVITIVASATAGLLWSLSPATGTDDSFNPLHEPEVRGFTIATNVVLDRDGVRRTTVVLAPGRPPAVDEYSAGHLSIVGLIHEVGAELGIRDDRYPGQCLAAYSPSRTTVDLDVIPGSGSIAGQTIVTITESFLGLTQSNSGLRLCTPDGLPGMAASGSITINVRDFDVIGVSPPPAASFVRAQERHYTWTTLAPSDTIAIALQRPPLAVLRDISGLSAYELVPGLGGQVLGSLLYLALVSVPPLLLLWAIGIRSAEGASPSGSFARQIVFFAGSLAVAPELAILVAPLIDPVQRGLQEVGPNVALQFGIPAARESDVVEVALYVLGLLVGLGLAGVARLVKFRPLGWLSGFVLRGIGLQLAILGVGTVALIVGNGLGAERSALRLAVWLSSATLICAVLWLLLAGFRGVAGDRVRRPVHWASLAVVPLALWLGIPVEDRLRAFQGQSLSEFAFSVNDELFALSGTVDLLLLVAVVVVARGLWSGSDATWEQSLLSDAGPRQRSQPIGIQTEVGTRAATVAALARVVFAAILVGNAGVIAGVPIALILAFFVFPVAFDPPGTTAVLASLATRLRDHRSALAAALLAPAEGVPDTSAGGSAGLLESPGRRASRRGLALASPPIVPKLAALSLGPSASPWTNAGRATRYGLILQVIPFTVYLVFFVPATLSGGDPRLWLDLGSRLIVFVAQWAGLAFFFGLFYEHLAEPTGLRKGLRFGGLLLLVTLPLRLLAAAQGHGSPSVIAFDALEIVLFVAALGLLFDCANLGIRISEFTRARAAITSLTATSGLQPVAVFGGTLVTAAIVAATSLLQGEIAQLVSSVLTPFLGPSGP